MPQGSGREPSNAPRDGGRGPAVRALATLAVIALALIATSPGPPTLEGRVIGEVALAAGESTERQLRIHVDPAGGGATTGTISLFFQASSGLQTSDTRDVTLAFVSASDAGGSFPPSTTFPVERCVTGCDLAYRVGMSAEPDLLPGSVIRYEVSVRLGYDFGSSSRDPALLRMDLDGRTTGPAAPVWSLLAGMLALIGGIALGPIVHQALEPRRRRWPALALVSLAVGLIGWMVVGGIVNLASFEGLQQLDPSPMLLLFVADPWSIILHGTLGWGVWRGIRRWPADGGWLLGLAAVAMVGLDGLWLAWWTTLDAVVQPLLLAIPFVLLGGLGGIVIGQAWRTQERATNDRRWAALAVLSHGVVIAGFGFLAERSLSDPFSRDPVSFLALIPAALVALAFRRWLGGRRRWLVLLDMIIAVVGLLGLWLWSATLVGLSTNPGRFEIDDVAVLVAVVAAVLAVVTSFHTMRASPGPRPASPPSVGSADRIVPVKPPTPVADDPSTT